ncbi:MAG: serine protein kinase [Deltaproteobacteria bacterium]|jgi:serine protein kinase|nr:serine protein kinase [Deltaproteobacteria bacterium]
MSDFKTIKDIARLQDEQAHRSLNWTGSFQDYLDLIKNNPNVIRTAYQRIYDMIMSYGLDVYTDQKKEITQYYFFQDPHNDGEEAVFGIDIPIMRLVNVLKGAAYGYGPEKRIILLHGPVGSAKSTIVRLLKKGLELYSRQKEGRIYTFDWILPEELVHISGGEKVFSTPMNEDPLLLIPIQWRKKILKSMLQDSEFSYPVNSLNLNGELNPASRLIFRELLNQYDGNWEKVVSNHIRIKRLILSEKDRVGIGTFQPKDEKNQDATELTGDINYRKIAEFGSDSDPRAFNFDGEFNISNRGIIEFIEVLKLDVAFLYDLLGATQEHKIKPKKFAQTDIDEVIIGHTNEAEYNKLLNNEFMEALRDRTIKVDIPYVTRIKEEEKIYKKSFNETRIKQHIAPHTLEMAGMWAILTRLEDPKKHNLSLLQKLKLYDGKNIPGFTVDNIKELRKETQREGMDGISPRYVQDKVSNVLVSGEGEGCINPFMVLIELEKGLKNHSLITTEEQKDKYKKLMAIVKEEYEEVVKNEVQRAISADESAISKLCANYINNLKAYTLSEKVKNKYTGEYMEPDEHLMRSIEEKIDIPDSRKDDFRRELMNYIGALAVEGKKFEYYMNERLMRALELKLFEDSRDAIKITSLVSGMIDKEEQDRIEIIKSRLIKNYNYCQICASDILQFVASIFARGDVK